MTLNNINWEAEVEARKEDFLDDLKTLLSIESVREDDKATPDAPVGPGPLNALNAFLEIGERDGFKTESFGNLAGHIQYGDQASQIGVLGHVDVVPVGTGWDTDPFTPVIKDDRIYARGSSDNKGPLMAAYYALKIVRDLGIPLKSKVNFIIGTDEESEWKCTDHYFSVNEKPVRGFSPDANFPIINGEKGNVTINITSGFEKETEGRYLDYFKSGLRSNMVPQDAEARVVFEEGADLQARIVRFEEYVEDSKAVAGTAEIQGQSLLFKLTGKASHGAMPQNGINAGTFLADFLNTLDLKGDGASFVKNISKYLHDDPYGSRLSLATNDEVMGDLTMNVGIMNFTQGEKNEVVVNYRYPKNISADKIEGAYQQAFSNQAKVEAVGNKDPHYVAADDQVVQTLLDIYSSQTGLEAYEQVIGGGTYGRLLERGVAYGAMFPDSVDTMHQANEFMALDDLYRAMAIYAEAIARLASEEDE